jgi:two-component system, NarL family, response regulator
MVRVLVADDFPLMREAFAATLAADPSLDVVATAADGAEALHLTRERRPDVAVLDLRMPRMTGAMVLACLSAELPEVRVLVVTGYDDAASLAQALEAGAAGVLTKRATGQELRDAVAAVHRGERVACASLPAPAGGGQPTLRLTASELDVLRMVADGRTDGQIASALHLSPRTVQYRVSRLRAKTGVARRTELACWAGEHLAA